MKSLEGIFELVDGIFPKDAKKIVMFCEVEKKAYEIFYYSYFADDSCKQCNELVDEGRIESLVLEQGFERIAAFIRECDKYDSDKRNVITLRIEGTLETVISEKFDRNIGLYKIKKDWKTANL